MRSAILLLVFLLPGAEPAAGAMSYLSWDNCHGSGGAAMNKSFACDTNDAGGPFRMVSAFELDGAAPDFIGVSLVLDFCTGPEVLPDWWRFAPGLCREGQFTFPGSHAGIGSGATGPCIDPYLGASTGGGWVQELFGRGWNSARIRMDFARDTPVALAAGQRYLAGVLELSQATTVDDGSGMCGGCQFAACFVLNAVEVFDLNLGVVATAEYSSVTWQGGAVGGLGCPFVVPARSSTWGRVKSLYR